MSDLFGIPIHVSQIPLERPRFQISKDVPMTDEFRKEMDQWCREFFGMEPYVLMCDPSAIPGLWGLGGKRLFMNPEQVTLLSDFKL